MAYNPVNLSQLTNNWTYVDPALTGGDTNKSFINTIAYSGSNLCFGGSFIFNYDNYPYTFPFYFPQNQFQYINIAYFDPGTQTLTLTQTPTITPTSTPAGTPAATTTPTPTNTPPRSPTPTSTQTPTPTRTPPLIQS